MSVFRFAFTGALAALRVTRARVPPIVIAIVLAVAIVFVAIFPLTTTARQQFILETGVSITQANYVDIMALVDLVEIEL